MASYGVDGDRCRQLMEQYEQFLATADVAVAGTSRCAASVMSLVYQSELSLLLQLVSIRPAAPADGESLAGPHGLMSPVATFQLDDSVVLNGTTTTATGGGRGSKDASNTKGPSLSSFSVSNAATPFMFCSTFRLLAEPLLSQPPPAAQPSPAAAGGGGVDITVMCRWMGWARSRPLTILNQSVAPGTSVGVLIALLARKVGHGRPYSLSCIPSGMPCARCAHPFNFWGELYLHVMNVRSGFIETLALAAELAKPSAQAAAQRTVEWLLQFVAPADDPSTTTSGGGGGAGSKAHGAVLSMGLLPNADRNALAALRHTAAPTTNNSSSASSSSSGPALVPASPANALRFFVVYHVAAQGKAIDDSRLVARPSLISASDGRASIYGWLKHFYPGNDDTADSWKVFVEVVAARGGDELGPVLDSRIVLLHALPRPRILRSAADIERADRPGPLWLGGAFIPLAGVTSDEEYNALLRVPTGAPASTARGQDRSLLHIPAPARLVVVHDVGDLARLSLA